ncbi:uncharacterized protein LOC135487864 isoform X2 [Lineus longissimus]|uniref:uncharacterized protein LOC135487864 isoform X2 n=1 Tax=Lineus longissimus TaxID=88925 RepID=UPI00315DC8BD
MNLTANLQLCRDMTAADFRTSTTAKKQEATAVMVLTSPSVPVVKERGVKTSTTRIRFASTSARVAPTKSRVNARTTSRVARTTTRVDPTTTRVAPTTSRVAPLTTMSAFIRRMKKKIEKEMRARGEMPPYEATGGKESPEHCEKPENHFGAKWLNPGPIRIGHSAVFVCEEGYAFVNGRRFFVTTCSPADGRLVVKAVPKCKVVQCKRLNLANTVATPNSTLQSVGKVVFYSCLDGYRFGDGTRHRHIQCGQDGQWDTKIPGGCQEAKVITYRRKSSGAERWTSCAVVIVTMLLLLTRMN